MKKVILAFSGGLDTSFCVSYLTDQGYDVITVTVNTGGFTHEELALIEQKSKQLGADKHYTVNGKKGMFDKIISYIIKTNGIYENSYPNLCTDRYIIAEEIVHIAKKEHAKAVSHGSSAMGNDQVRFDLAFMSLAPNFEIITPIREMGGNRKKEKAYLEQKGYSIPSKHGNYSINQNILGITYSGSEIDQLKEPDQSLFQWTQLKKTKTSYLDIGFEQGIPTSLAGKKMEGVHVLETLNLLAGEYGIGQDYYTGNCIIGIKGHIAFEAPGILTLIKAHSSLEQLTLTKQQQILGKCIHEQFTDLLYTGKYYEPAVKDIEAFIDSQQKHVTGTVLVKLQPHQAQIVSVSSPFSLINTHISTYAQDSSWSAKDVEGFIKLYGLQGKISSLLNDFKKEKKI